jgi:hypothetical protein
MKTGVILGHFFSHLSHFGSFWLTLVSFRLTLSHFGKLGNLTRLRLKGSGTLGQEIPFFSTRSPSSMELSVRPLAGMSPGTLAWANHHQHRLSGYNNVRRYLRAHPFPGRGRRRTCPETRDAVNLPRRRTGLSKNNLPYVYGIRINNE